MILLSSLSSGSSASYGPSEIFPESDIRIVNGRVSGSGSLQTWNMLFYLLMFLLLGDMIGNSKRMKPKFSSIQKENPEPFFVPSFSVKMDHQLHNLGFSAAVVLLWSESEL